jgi:hypothetical protein
MLSRIVLDYEKSPEVIDQESLFTYSDTKRLQDLHSLEAIADTRELTLSYLEHLFPSLRNLRLNNSQIPSIRDISPHLTNLRFLSLAHCSIRSLDGICTLSNCLEELYLAFNHITDITELIGLTQLRVLDLEENEIQHLAEIELLSCCTHLKALTLIGNPATECESYREEVQKYLPNLRYLDEKRLNRERGSVKIEKRSRCGGKPCSAEGRRDQNKVVSEMVEDKVGERLPSARAYGGKGFQLIGCGGKSKKIVTPMVLRPQSGCRGGSRLSEVNVSTE